MHNSTTVNDLMLSGRSDAPVYASSLVSYKGPPRYAPDKTDLGLTFTRELLETHAGTVWAESPGVCHGRRFTFTLPLSQAHARKEGDGPSVLVVDDDDALRELITDILEDEGYHVNVARNGIDALNCLKTIQPAVILLDWMMPQMDGPAFAAELRRRGLCPGTPIVVMTAAGEARQRAATIGANAYLPKPFNVSLLIEEVAQLAGGRNEAGS